MAVIETNLNALAREAAAELGIVGAQISVLHRGEIAEGVTGIADVRDRTPITPDTLFQVGSTTKVLTAALVMSLVEEGRIGLDDPVVEQLPGFALSDREAVARVTPRHLMSMSSGIENGPYTDYGPGDDALARYVEALADLPHLFPPGEGYAYSNASTCVSGRLVEHATRQTWEQALRERILEPAGLADTHTSPEEVLIRRHALGHALDADGRLTRVQQWSQSRSKAPSGGTLCSTATDLVRFSHIFLHGGVSLDSAAVLPPTAVAAMQTREVIVPPTLAADWWGLGPYGRLWGGVEILGHSGTNNSGSSYLLWAVDRDFAVATTVNVPEFGYPFAMRVFRDLFPAIAGIATPDPPEPTGDVDFDLHRLVGTYAMHGMTLNVVQENGGVSIEGTTSLAHSSSHTIERTPLTPLSAVTFLHENPKIDGRRGWALAFLGPDDAPATHLVNGFFTLRRVPVS